DVDGKGEPRARSLRGSTFSLAFVRPNRIRLRSGSLDLVSDGRTMVAVARSRQRFALVDAPGKISLATFTEGPLKDLVFKGPHARQGYVLLALVLGGDLANECFAAGEGHCLAEPDCVVKGRVLKALRIKPGGLREQPFFAEPPEMRPDIRLLIDPATRL